MQHRSDIQILRGIAVLLVVLYHIRLPGFTHGFLGVDAFFVISGFLMALLYRQGEPGQFFSRRAVRLLPAYFATIIATVLASAFITLPSEHEQVLEQALFATGFASNIGFWLQNSYFVNASFNPLLHLWSLGVEIQFYLIVPLLFWMHQRSRLVLPVLLAGSLLLCLVMVTVSSKTAFFMMPLRIWQFLAGAAVARYLTRDGTPLFVRPMLGSGAAALFLATTFSFPVQGEATNILNGHPGLAAVLVTLQIAAVLALGLPERLVGSLPGKALQRLGDWSYSIYLAHFPVIVLLFYTPFSGTILKPVSLTGTFTALALICLFSAVLWLAFDRRRSPTWASWGKPRGLAAMAFLSLGAVFLSNPLQSIRFSGEEQHIFSAVKDRDVYRCGKTFRILHPGALACEVFPGQSAGFAADAPVLLLVGDSHADAIKKAFAEAAARRGYRVFLTVSNAPLLVRPDSGAVLALAEQLGATGVILHYSSAHENEAYLTPFVDGAREAGLAVAWLLPVPIYAESVPKLLWDDLQSGSDPGAAAGKHVPVNLVAMEASSEEARRRSLRSFDPRRILCPAECMITDREGGGGIVLRRRAFITDWFQSTGTSFRRDHRGNSIASTLKTWWQCDVETCRKRLRAYSGGSSGPRMKGYSLHSSTVLTSADRKRRKSAAGGNIVRRDITRE